jgi:hypothetical protein
MIELLVGRVRLQALRGRTESAVPPSSRSMRGSAIPKRLAVAAKDHDVVLELDIAKLDISNIYVNSSFLQEF